MDQNQPNVRTWPASALKHIIVQVLVVGGFTWLMTNLPGAAGFLVIVILPVFIILFLIFGISGLIASIRLIRQRQNIIAAAILLGTSLFTGSVILPILFMLEFSRR